tara:strand:+ start:170 stop:499 length:330 start_codon:yes stop_codon:yes gene_type:complete
MAIAFKNTSTTVATADTMETMYTAPGSVTGSIVHAIYIANKHLTSAIVCSLVLADNSASTEKYIMKDITVFRNTSLVVDKVVNLEPSDSLKLQSSSTECDVVMSVLELS